MMGQDPFLPSLDESANKTEVSLAKVAGDACAAGGNEEDFQTACDALAASTDSQIQTAVSQLSPEQVAAQGTNATKVSGGQMRQIAGSLIGRLSTLRSGGPVAALDLDWNGQKAAYGVRDALATGAAGDDGGPRFGAFLSGTWGTGNVDNTRKLIGYDYDLGGLTAGADVSFEKFVVGAAFSWLRSESDFKHNQGNVDADSYDGSIYATLFPIDGLYFDAIVTYGATDFDTKRKIQYTDSSGTVSTNAHANSDGWQVAVSGGVGYDVELQALTITPYFRAGYARLEVDGFSEHGGAGWSLRYDSQNVDSVTTTLGSEVAYAFSLPFGVLVPQLRGEWIHEYEDNSRSVGAIFRGDTSTQGKFHLYTDSADSDYFTFGTELAATFANGIGAYAAYDLLLGYSDVESHKLTVGGRIEF